MPPQMAYLSLYRKYRPQTFDEILGQEAVSKTLANAIVEDRVAHAYLFTGPRGTGKTSTARILAKAINCEQGPTPTPCGECRSCVAIADGSSLDLIEMDAASHSKVDETREILAGVALATAGGRRKVYVIDEVHMLSTGSFNALLKTLEEPPEHVLFVLATTEAHKVLPTIVSRTQRFDFRRITPDVLQKHLEHIAQLEGIDVEPEALAIVARHADGSARDALSVLDQLASFSGTIAADEVERLLGERREDALHELFDAIAAEDVGGVFSVVQSFMALGADARQLALAVLEHARSLLLVKASPDAGVLLDAPGEDRTRLSEQGERFSGAHLLRLLDNLAKALAEMRNVPNHRLLLEVALVRAAAPETDPAATGLLGRIERLERRLSIASDPAPAPTVARREATTATVESGTGGSGDRPEPEAAEPGPQAVKPRDEQAPDEREPREEAGEATPAVRPEHLGINHVKEAWPATLKEVNRRSKRVWGLLNPSRPSRSSSSPPARRSRPRPPPPPRTSANMPPPSPSRWRARTRSIS
jgi:DNA polymerase III subunit gamma/tau